MLKQLDFVVCKKKFMQTFNIIVIILSLKVFIQIERDSMP